MFYLFQLGHQPEISTAELEAVFSLHENKKIKIQEIKNYLLFDTDEELDTEKLINQLGGTIKIASSIPPFIKGEQGEILAQITNHLADIFPTGKIEFSLNDPKLALQIKKALKNLGRSVRYVELKNTATILHNKLVEKKSDLTVIDNKLFYTTAIQPFEEMAGRDYGRPGADNKSGMLPPKLAKIMLNLAISGIPSLKKEAVKNFDQLIILDPFCGSGTVLTEAVAMNYKNIIGSDISEKAIKDTEKNLEWLISSYRLLSINHQLQATDVQKLSVYLKPNSVDVIVTEPYLGQPLRGNESENFIKKQTQELKQLYLNAFQEFYKILKTDGIIVFIIPRFHLSFLRKQESRNHQNTWLKIEIEDEIQKIGFKLQPFNNKTHLLYHRQNQHLAREIWRFKKSVS